MKSRVERYASYRKDMSSIKEYSFDDTISLKHSKKSIDDEFALEIKKLNEEKEKIIQNEELKNRREKIRKQQRRDFKLSLNNELLIWSISIFLILVLFVLLVLFLTGVFNV